MQEDERDLLEVLIFDEIEGTIGTSLRTIIRRLEKEQTDIRKDYDKQPTSSGGTLTAMPCTRSTIRSPQSRRVTVLDRRRQVVPISGRSGFGKLG